MKLPHSPWCVIEIPITVQCVCIVAPISPIWTTISTKCTRHLCHLTKLRPIQHVLHPNFWRSCFEWMFIGAFIVAIAVRYLKLNTKPNGIASWSITVRTIGAQYCNWMTLRIAFCMSFVANAIANLIRTIYCSTWWWKANRNRFSPIWWKWK